MLRWWLVALLFVALNIPLLYLSKDVAGLSLPLASLVTGELATLARFIANDRWVFRRANPNWTRLWQFHVAVAGSFALWWIVTNGVSILGLHYLLASVVGNASTVALGMGTHFLWIWREPHSPPAATPVPAGSRAERP